MILGVTMQLPSILMVLVQEIPLDTVVNIWIGKNAKLINDVVTGLILSLC